MLGDIGMEGREYKGYIYIYNDITNTTKKKWDLYGFEPPISTGPVPNLR